MAKEIPHFHFVADDWQNGTISGENYMTKGVFVDICGYYWAKDCVLSKSMALKKHPDVMDIVKHLIDVGIIKYNENTDQIHIEFLDEQYEKMSERYEMRRKSGEKSANLRWSKKSKGKKGKSAPSKPVRFKKPTIKEIEAHCQQRKNGVNATRFYNFYESKGWMVGKNKMKDWKAAVITWEKRDAQMSAQGVTPPADPPDIARIKRADL